MGIWYWNIFLNVKLQITVIWEANGLKFEFVYEFIKMHYLISNLFAKLEPLVFLKRFQSHDTLQNKLIFFKVKDSRNQTEGRTRPSS